MRVSFHLNDERFVLDVAPEASLVDILRDEFAIKSVHEGCRQGHCGSCMVILNNMVVPSCLVPAFSCRDSVIETVEGLGTRADFVDIERGFLKSGFSPCSFCASSKALLAESLLRSGQDLTRDLILSEIPEHWCNCSSTEDFIAAVMTSWDFRRKRQTRGVGI